MRRLKYLFLMTSALAVTFGVASCGGGSDTPLGEFDFTVELKSKRKNVLYLNEKTEAKQWTDSVDVHEVNPVSGKTYTYEYSIVTPRGEPAHKSEDYVRVDNQGRLYPVALTPSSGKYELIQVQVVHWVREPDPEDPEDPGEYIMNNLFVKVVNKNPNANEGANYSSDKLVRNEALGQLEAYAMNNFLTGITLFENGGWVRYSNRVTLGSENYIAGYGFGLLSEGSLDPTKPLSGVTDQWKNYLRSATSSETYSINAWDTEGSQIADLNSYITSSYWGTKIDYPEDPSASSTNLTYKWYPSLAKDKINRYNLDGSATDVLNNVENNRPVPVDDDGRLITSATKNEKGLYRRWRVYVKTNEVSYYTLSSSQSAYNRPIQLEDYVFPFKLLLTQAAGTFRGAELASDTSYGIKGGYTFFRNTKEITYQKANEEWTKATTPVNGVAQLGIYTGTSDELGNHEYIEFELINPIDDFTAMYTLSSNLYSPLPEEFVTNLPGSANGWITGAKIYGMFGDKPSGWTDSDWMQRLTLGVGPFTLERWDTTSQIVFKRNDNWFEVGERYHIPGVHITINSAATKEPNTFWNMFNSGELDSAGLPKSYLETHKPPVSGYKDYQTKGDSTFKLNVNSCTQERSDYLFGEHGVINKSTTPRTVHKWMSNNNFLRGIFWSIKREAFATSLGVNPSYEYFADSYLTDVLNPNWKEGDPVDEKYISTSYNRTPEHAAAIENFDKNLPTSNYGYNSDIAARYFKSAISELKKEISLGTPSNPKILQIDVWWMYQSEIEEYGNNIKNYIEDVFNNDEDICGKCAKIYINNDFVQNWEDVYKLHLMIGDFDLGFGAISGNTLNPLNFMEVLRSDNSSGFTLNWGADTSKVSDAYPIVLDGKEWTYDSLWAAADHGVIAENAEEVKPVKEGYMKFPRSLANWHNDVNKDGDLSAGGFLYVPFEFVSVAGVTCNVTKVQLYLPGTDNLVLTERDILNSDVDGFKIVEDTVDGVTKHVLLVRISQNTADDINKRLVTANDLEEAAKQVDDPAKKKEILTPFMYKKYSLYWSLEVYFDLEITGATPVENVYYVTRSGSDDNKSLARMK